MFNVHVIFCYCCLARLWTACSTCWALLLDRSSLASRPYAYLRENKKKGQLDDDDCSPRLGVAMSHLAHTLGAMPEHSRTRMGSWGFSDLSEG